MHPQQVKLTDSQSLGQDAEIPDGLPMDVDYMDFGPDAETQVDDMRAMLSARRPTLTTKEENLEEGAGDEGDCVENEDAIPDNPEPEH